MIIEDFEFCQATLQSRDVELTALASKLKSINSTRNELLFTKFLPIGYEATTLSSVPDHLFEKVLLTKVRIGTIITIYDDFADHPKLRNPQALRQLYNLPFSMDPLNSDNSVIAWVSHLWNQVMLSIRSLPNYPLLKDIFEFDVQQFYTANRYSELVSKNPYLVNQRENRAYLPHNMGILIAATIDLMASANLQVNELGRIRSFIYQSQIIARIMNVTTTFDREIKENDITGEIVAGLIEQGHLNSSLIHILERTEIPGFHRNIIHALTTEKEFLIRDLEAKASSHCNCNGKRICSFDAGKYIKGLRALNRLHESMKEEI